MEGLCSTHGKEEILKEKDYTLSIYNLLLIPKINN